MTTRALAIGAAVVVLLLVVLALWPSPAPQVSRTPQDVAEAEAARARRDATRAEIEAIAAPYLAPVNTEEDRARREAARVELEAIALRPMPTGATRAEDEARILAAAEGVSTAALLDSWRARR